MHIVSPEKPRVFLVSCMRRECILVATLPRSSLSSIIQYIDVYECKMVDNKIVVLRLYLMFLGLFPSRVPAHSRSRMCHDCGS